ncbi:hypothetical protein ASD22_13205 [Rhodanobacter sp. Root480]|nr:hypothetical protein ASD22_13205 [Rhodanobacter sp. Root480]
MGFFEPLDAIHHVEKPSALFELRLVSQEQRAPPRLQNVTFGDCDTIGDDADAAGWGDFSNEDIAANPSGSARRRCKWFTAFDDLRYEKLTGNHEEIAHPGLCSIIG